MGRKIDLRSEFNLMGTEKIIIETLEFVKDKPRIKREISDKEIIASVLTEISQTEETGGIDTWCHYQISFYKGKKKILVLEFHDEDKSGFLRYRSKGVSKDYIITNEFSSLLHKLVTD